MDVLASALHQLAHKPRDVCRGEIGQQVLSQDLRNSPRVRNVSQLDKLIRAGLHKGMLRFDSAVISRDIADPVAAERHRVNAVQMLHPRCQIDVALVTQDILVHILHLFRHVKVHAAQFVDDLDKGVQVQNRVAVRCKARQPVDLLQQRIDPVSAPVQRAGIDGVDLAHIRVRVCDGVPRNADEVHFMLHRIESPHQDRVGAPAHLVQSDQQHGIDTVLPAVLKRRSLRHRFRGWGRLNRGLRLRAGRGFDSRCRLFGLHREGRRFLPHQIGSCPSDGHNQQSSENQKEDRNKLVFFLHMFSPFSVFLYYTAKLRRMEQKTSQYMQLFPDCNCKIRLQVVKFL